MKAGKMRRVCPSCGYIYGRDPRAILGLLILWSTDVLFVRRTIAGQGAWSLPLYPCRERQDARAMTGGLFEFETRLSAQVGRAVDTFNIDTREHGSVLVLMFSATLPRESIVERANLMAANRRSSHIPAPPDLTAEILKRLRGSGTILQAIKSVSAAIDSPIVC